MKIFTTFLLFITYAHAQKIDQQWLNLLHLKKDVFGNYYSEAKEEQGQFFLHSKGEKDPEKEMEVTLQAFLSEKNEKWNKNSISCRFPARYLWAKSKLKGLSRSPKDECPYFKAYYQKINPRSASLIFSSYFINVPSSAFGHTFLRINSKNSKGTGSELLDYGVNFAAQVDTQNGLVYLVKGLGGFFRGYFTTLPYYYKVREYNDYESRDLWEYELNLSTSEVDLIVAHLWEVQNNFFYYYYLTKNCSYFILELIDIARPELNLVANTPYYVIPIDTVKVLDLYPDLIKEISYRPSLKNKLDQTTEKFTKTLIKKVHQMASHPNSEELIGSDQEKAELLEASILFFDYKNAKELVFGNKKIEEQRHELLLKRSEIETILPERKFENRFEPPHLSHPNRRISLMGGNQTQLGGQFLLEHRFALHDIYDPLTGHSPYSQTEVAKVRLRFQEERRQYKKVYLDEIEAFNVANYQPMGPWGNNISWKLKISSLRLDNPNCFSCYGGRFLGGLGKTIGYRKHDFLSFLLVTGLDYAAQLPDHFDHIIGPQAVFRSSLAQLTLGVKVNYFWYSSFSYQKQLLSGEIESRYHLSKKYNLSARYEGFHQFDNRYSAGLNYFY